MKNYLLIINAGSSSIKFALFLLAPGCGLQADASGQMDAIGIKPHLRVVDETGQTLIDQDCSSHEIHDHDSALAFIRGWIDIYQGDGRLVAVGHRVVHGGSQYVTPVLVNAGILDDLERLTSLAPLHQPHNLSPIRSLLSTMPELPQVACFDTAFHSTQPDVARCVALPRQFEEEGVCRYGFHGLSYEYIASILPELAPNLQSGRVIVAHLGNGASLCALQDSRSIATTMGFSPLDGLVMGTRCGAIDPGVLLYLMERHGMDAQGLTKLLYHQSGLLGVSGLSSDMRVLLESETRAAQEAVALFVYRIAREIGSLVAALGGLDALIFTGGIGENAAQIRTMIGTQAAWLGVVIDENNNQRSARCISASNAKVSVWVVPTNENLMIARHTLRLIGM